MPRIKASLLYFAIVLGTGFALGVFALMPFLLTRVGPKISLTEV